MLLLPTISFLYERWQLYKTYRSIHGFLTWSIQLQWYSGLDVTAINLNCILWFLWWTGLLILPNRTVTSTICKCYIRALQTHELYLATRMTK